MTTWHLARMIAGKDLRIERHSKVVTNQVLPFAGITMISFAFALDKQNVIDTVAPGLIWLATMFSLLVLVQRSFAIETDDGALDAMRVAGVDARSIFLGKAMALGVQLLVLELMLLVAAVIFYGESIPSGDTFASVVLLVTTMLSATCGLAAVGTLYGGLAAGFKGSETLLPLLTLPAVAPVLIGATKAVESAVGTAGAVVSEGWRWVGLLAVFAVAFGVGGALAFGPLIDE
jgi:heme exporter protein B